MKKKIIAIGCAVLVLAAAGGTLAWHFLGKGTSGGDENVVYVNTVKSLTNLGAGNGMQNRYAGVVESENSWKVEKNAEKTVKEIFVEEGQDVEVGTPLFTYDTEKYVSDLEQAQLDLERINNEISSMNSNINQLYKDKKSAAKDQQATLTLEIQEAELELKRKEYEGKSKQAEIDKLKENITNATVISEIAGVVKSINKDDNSQSGYYGGESDNSFITVLATGDYRVKGKINEQNIGTGDLIEGARVLIHSRVNEEQVWTGTVSKIDLENAESNNNNYYYGNSDSMTQTNSYPFYVALDTTAGLMLGQHVYIEVDNGQGEEERTGIWLNEFFINDADTDPYVWADNGNGKLEKRSVTLGEYDENLMEYQITDGLDEADAITFPEEGLEEGMTTVVTSDGSMGQSNPAGQGEDGMYEDGMYEDGMPEDGMMEDGMTEDGIGDGSLPEGEMQGEEGSIGEEGMTEGTSGEADSSGNEVDGQ